MTTPELPENAYRARAERGEVQIGTWITMIRTPSVLTLLQAAGLDYARLDLEHSAFSIETVADMAALARALDFPLVVRPPEGNREWITRLLDAGVWNLHIPQVENARQAAEVVAATRYAPLGSRGMYGSGPHTGYRVRPPAEHLATANARVHVTAMLESKGAFEHLDEIAAVPGIDALTIGPTDLAQDLGILGTPSQSTVLREHRVRLGEAARKHGKTVAMAVDTIEAVREVIALGATIGPTDLAQDLGILGTPAQSTVLREHRVRLGEAARKHGKTVAMAVDTIEAVREVIALGATIVNYSSDTNVLRSSYAAAVAEIRKSKERS